MNMTRFKRAKLNTSLRMLFLGSHTKDLLRGSEGKLTPREVEIFKLGVTKGAEYIAEDVTNVN